MIEQPKTNALDAVLGLQRAVDSAERESSCSSPSAGSVLADRMTQDERQAYEWALEQQFQSVAARYARQIALFIEAQNGKVRRDVGLSPISWEREDELPEMSDDEFSAIFPESRLSGGTFGVRVYPYVKDADGNKIFISKPNAAMKRGK